MNLLRLCGLLSVFVGWLTVFSIFMIALYLTENKAIVVVATVFTLIAAVFGYIQDKHLKSIDHNKNSLNNELM